MSLVCISIVFRNEEDKLENLLSTLEQDLILKENSSYELMFIDNHSSDESVSLINNWCKRQIHLKYQIIKRDENNMAKARQQALESTGSKWIAFIDADNQLEKDWAKKVLNVLDSLPEETVAVGGESNYQIQKPWHEFVIPLANYFPLGKEGSKTVSVDHLPTHNYLVKKTAALKAGGFDPFFSNVGEDLDFNVRLKKIGNLIYEPLFSVTHDLPETQSQWFLKMAYYGRAQGSVATKYLFELPLVKFAPALMVILGALVMIFSPIIAFVVFFTVLISQRVQFLFLSFCFYGMGEFIGASQFLLYKLVGRQAPKSLKIPN